MKYKSLFIIIGLLFFIGTIGVKAEDINSKIINGNNVLVDYDINGSVLISGFNININNNSIDNSSIQNDIVQIMEGGPEAFKRRQQIYKEWKINSSI